MIMALSKVIEGYPLAGNFLSLGGQGQREAAMKFGTIANSQQVDAMGHVVARYCQHIGVDAGTPEGERVAKVVLALHEIGIRGENELLRALIVPKERLPSGAHWG